MGVFPSRLRLVPLYHRLLLTQTGCCVSKKLTGDWSAGPASCHSSEEDRVQITDSHSRVFWFCLFVCFFQGGGGVGNTVQTKEWHLISQMICLSEFQNSSSVDGKSFSAFFKIIFLKLEKLVLWEHQRPSFCGPRPYLNKGWIRELQPVLNKSFEE